MIQERKAQIKNRGRFENVEHVCAACGQPLAVVPFRFGNDAGSLGLDSRLAECGPGFYDKPKRTARGERGVPYGVTGISIGYTIDDELHNALSLPLDGRTIRVKCPHSECGVINEVTASR